MAADEDRAGAPPWKQLQRLLIGYRLTQAIGVAAQFGIADRLAEGPRDADDLARAAGVRADALYRVLRLLASEGIFVETEPRRFALTALADLLRSDVEGSLRPRALIEAGEWSQAWAALPHAVVTGRPAFTHVFGAPPFDYYRENPPAAELFNATMTSMTVHVTRAIVAAYDFSDCQTVVDVGGGHGTLLAAILAANPHLRGILFDLPHVLPGAEPVLAAAGVAGRCSLVPGDFFSSVPAAADAYLMKFILDDWDDADALTILRNIRRAMAADGRLLVIEMPIPPGNDPFYGKWTDVNMLVMLGGRERTEDDYRRLFGQADFDLERIIPTEPDFSIIEGVGRRASVVSRES